jgi:hypothetical protein
MKNGIVLFSGLALLFVAVLGLSSTEAGAPWARNIVGKQDAALLFGAANDARFKIEWQGCTGYSKTGPGGIQLRCPRSETIIDPVIPGTGTLCAPGLKQTCYECSIPCGSVQFLGYPNQGG